MQHLMRNIVGTLAVLALVAGCATPSERSAGKAGSIEIWWLGQSAMRITTVSGKVIMIDPWILGKLDLILVTHAHGDHLGDAVALAKKNNVPMWAPAGLNQQLQTLGELPAELS